MSANGVGALIYQHSVGDNHQSKAYRMRLCQQWILATDFQNESAKKKIDLAAGKKMINHGKKPYQLNNRPKVNHLMKSIIDLSTTTTLKSSKSPNLICSDLEDDFAPAAADQKKLSNFFSYESTPSASVVHKFMRPAGPAPRVSNVRLETIVRTSTTTNGGGETLTRQVMFSAFTTAKETQHAKRQIFANSKNMQNFHYAADSSSIDEKCADVEMASVNDQVREIFFNDDKPSIVWSDGDGDPNGNKERRRRRQCSHDDDDEGNLNQKVSSCTMVAGKKTENDMILSGLDGEHERETSSSSSNKPNRMTDNDDKKFAALTAKKAEIAANTQQPFGNGNQFFGCKFTYINKN